MRRMTAETQPPVWLELAAAALVPAAVMGFARVFDGLAPLLPIIGAALLSTAVSVLCRRLAVPLLLTAPISALLLAALIMNRYAPGTAQLGILPTGETTTELTKQFDELVRNFQELQTPVPALEPFVAAAMVGAWIMAFLTDWGAMRLRLAFEPVLPSALLFVFTSIPPVSAGQNRILATVAFASAIAFWAVAQRINAMRERGVWLANDRQRGPVSLAQAGVVIAALAVAAGAYTGGRIPGADAEAVYSFANREDSTRLVVSPYVKLYSRLVEQTDQELFTVEADRPSYWRIAGLDSYEQNIWKLAGDFSREDGELPATTELGGERTELEQTFEIKSLAAIWLPAAFPPTEIVETTADMTWHADTSSLTVDGKTPNGDGVSYTVTSSVGTFSAEALRAAPDVVSPEIAERYLDLPALPSVLSETAREVTAGSATRYDQMRALQDFFQTKFTYEVKLGPALGDPISQFLTERQGFCQQFAGTFALMARELGAPARVATGFTWGNRIGTSEAGRPIYSVTGAQTHAWPEVYFSGLGWVPFEPTPGRGIPDAAYTGYEMAQDEETPTETPEDLASPAPSLPSQQEIPEPEFEDIAPVGLGEDEGFSIPWRTVLPLLALVFYLVGMPLLRRLMRLRRRSQAGQGAPQVEVAWDEAAEALDLGVELRRSPAETRTEFAERLRNGRSVGADQMAELATLATVARFYPSGIDATAVDRADGLAKQIEQAVHDRVPGYARYFKELSPFTVPGVSRSRQSSPSAGALVLPAHETAVETSDRELVNH